MTWNALGVPAGAHGGRTDDSFPNPNPLTRTEAESLALGATPQNRSALILTQYLSGMLRFAPEENVGSLQQSLGRIQDRLQQDPALRFQGALTQLSHSEITALRAFFGNGWEHYLYLSEEADPRLFYEGLLQQAQRQLEGTQAWQGAYLLQALSQEKNTAAIIIPPSIRQRAQEKFSVLQGGGSWGARLQYVGGRFAQEALDPGMILGLGLAGMASSVLRFRALSRFARMPARFWNRGLSARALASVVAFPAEVGAFWGTHRAVAAWTHPEQLAWDANTLGSEVFHSALSLGLLKLTGWGLRSGFDRAIGFNALTGNPAHLPWVARFSRPLMGQVGMFAGLTTAGMVERSLAGQGLYSDGMLLDSLAMLFQFNLAARLSHRVMGPRHEALMREVNQRTLRLEREMGPRETADRGNRFARWFGSTPQWVGAQAGPGREMAPNMEGARPLLSSKLPDGDGPISTGIHSGGRSRPAGGVNPAALNLSRPRTRTAPRNAIEERIVRKYPGYLDHLGKLLSETTLAELEGNPCETSLSSRVRTQPEAVLQQRIREYLDETGIKRLSLNNASVREAVGRVWKNRPQDRAETYDTFYDPLEGIEEAYQLLFHLEFPDGSSYRPSRLERGLGLSRALGRDIYIFSDTGRTTGSFKERGALVAVHRAHQEGANEVVTASHGNHGLAVALAAKLFNLRATVVVPHTTPRVKVEALENLGAIVVKTHQQPERGYEEARDWGLRYSMERNDWLREQVGLERPAVRYIHGFEDVIPGQGVAGIEIADGWKSLQGIYGTQRQAPVVLIPLGGGGLAAGVALSLRMRLPEAKIIGVVSGQAPAMHYSLMKGERTEVLLNPQSLFDSGIGLAVPGRRPFEILREVLDGTVTVNEALGGEAIRYIYNYENEVVEGGGAAGIAALLSGQLSQLGVRPEDPIITMFTGRNIDGARHQRIMEGREARLAGGLTEPNPFPKDQGVLYQRIQPLIAALERGEHPQVVQRILENLEIGPEELKPYIHFSSDGYSRNTLLEKPGEYEIVFNGWLPGQRTGFHDHGPMEWGLFRAVLGMGKEVQGRLENGEIQLTGIANLVRAGEVGQVDPLIIHDVLNVQGEGRNFGALHVYSPPPRGAQFYPDPVPSSRNPSESE